MDTKKSRLRSPSPSSSRSPISENEKGSVSPSARRGPSTPLQSSAVPRHDSDEEHDPTDRDLLTLGDESKAMLDETSSNVVSDTDENQEKKRAHHRHHHHRRHHKQAKSNKRSASHQRHSAKRSKKDSGTTTRQKKPDGENSRSSSEKKTSESEASKSEQGSSSGNESNNEEGMIEGNNSATERRSRRHHKKRRSSASNNERNSPSSQSPSSNNPSNSRGTQLIVNYLPSSLRESDFYQLFARVAPVKLCKLITDRHTGHSFCYGFVEYHSKDDAVKAIEKFNGYKIEHKKLKVSYAQPKSSGHSNDHVEHERPMGSSQKNPNIYITDLPEAFDEKMLERLFSKYGEIVKTKVLRDPRTRISRGVAFVLMTSSRYAERAVKALDGYVPSGARAPISVKYADPAKTTSGHNGSYNNNNNNSSSRYASSAAMAAPPIGPYGYPPGLPTLGIIDPYYAAAALHHHHQHQHHRAAMNMRDMSPSPPPLQAYYGSGRGGNRSYSNHAGGSSTSRTRNSSPGLPRSYSNSSSKHSSSANASASNNLATPSSLAAACDLISKGCQQAIDPNGFVIYAFGLPHDCNEADLDELFRRYGDVYRVYIVRNYATGESKGYSFVTMRNYEEACHAVTRLDGSAFQGRTIQVRFKQ